jgi:hypothetical protein
MSYMSRFPTGVRYLAKLTALGPYPQTVKYKGHSRTEEAANFVCQHERPERSRKAFASKSTLQADANQCTDP